MALRGSVFDTFTFQCQRCVAVVTVTKGQEQPHNCLAVGVNGGQGDNSIPLDGADDAPNKPKGATPIAPAPAADTP